MNNNSEARHLIDEVSVFCAFDEIVDIKELKENPRNPNTHPSVQIELLAQIIKKTGWRAPITVSNLSGFIVKGHGRLQAAKAAGLKQCPVEYQNFKDEEEEMSALLADNKLAELAEIDVEKLTEIFKDVEFEDLSLTGYSKEEFDELIDVFEEADLLGDPDEVPEEVETRCKLGDIWQLGNHRLMCGDSTCKSDVQKLVNGEKADMVFTDPPYGMNAVSNSGVLSKNYKTDILNDDNNQVAISSFKLVHYMFGTIKQVWWGANYYTECLPSSECWIVWDKNNGASDQTDCELAWTNFRSVVRQFTLASEKTNRVHPTQKPVKLIQQILDKFEKDIKFEIILDLFGGSGSTLIACEQLNRKCFMMELDPHYCDVIITRWETLTGKKAMLLNK